MSQGRITVRRPEITLQRYACHTYARKNMFEIITDIFVLDLIIEHESFIEADVQILQMLM